MPAVSAVGVIMIVAVACASAEGEYMGGQPFWLAKITKLTAHHITLWYYGDKFLKQYSLLLKKKTRHEFTWPRGEITILHWNIKFVKTDKKGPSGTERGYLSAPDQKVLGFDVRVNWQPSKP